MPIPSEIQGLIARLNAELTEIEDLAMRGLELLRPALARFPHNELLVNFFASFNNALFMVNLYQRRIETAIELLSADKVPQEVIQEAGEELGGLLGRALESKIGVRLIITRLEELQ